MKRMLDHALAYRARGWSVIPIRPRSKLPLIQWAKFQHEKPTEADIRQWWKDTPDANIGVITGKISNIVVVDVDVHHGGDPKPIFEDTPTGLVQRTPSGGFHLIYEYPKDTNGVIQSCAAIRDGVDIRGDGGYIVVAPSIGSNKRAYSWSIEKGLGSMPEWADKGAAEENGSIRLPPKGDTNWVTTTLAGVKKGNRNNSAARLAGYFASKNTPPDITLDILMKWNSTAVDPPLPYSEIKATVLSVYQKDIATRQSKAESPVAQQKQKPKVEQAKQWLTPIDVTMRRAANYEMMWDVQDWLPRSTVGMVVSPPGAYKTWCMLDLAISMATGKPFLGSLPVLNTGPVFIFQQEDSHYSLMDRLAAILQSRYGAGETTNDDGWEVMTPPKGLPIWIHEHRQLRFDIEASIERLAKEVGRIRPRLVVIDPLYMAAGEDSSFMADTVQNLRVLKDLRDKYGTSFMIVHHTKKNVGQSPGRMDAWGSQFLNAFLETGWQIRPVFIGGKKGEQYSTKAVRLERHFKDPDSDIMPLYLQFNISDSGYGVDLLEDVEEIKKSSASNQDLLRQFELPNTISQAARDSGLDKSTVSRRVSKWREDETILETKKGGKTRYVLAKPLGGDLFDAGIDGFND